MPQENRSRWGVALEGHSFDLEDWEDDLKPPFDPTVIGLPDPGNSDARVRILQSTTFESCASASEVREAAIPLVRTLSGLIGVRRDANPVTVGNVIEFFNDGSWNRHAFADGALIEGRSKVRATGASVVDGVPIEPAAPSPSYAQSLLDSLSDNMRAALQYYDRADNWHDLYKAYEAVLSHLHPRSDTKAKEKLKSLGFTDRELTGLSGSPQHFRHHKTRAPLIFNFAEAKALTRRIIDAVLQSIG